MHCSGLQRDSVVSLVFIYIFIHQKMIATKQIENRRNEKLYSGHNIENKVTYVT